MDEQHAIAGRSVCRCPERGTDEARAKHQRLLCDPFPDEILRRQGIDPEVAYQCCTKECGRDREAWARRDSAGRAYFGEDRHCCRTCRNTEGEEHSEACEARWYRCCMSGCNRDRRSWAWYCCRTCRATGGREHGEMCEAQWREDHPGEATASPVSWPERAEQPAEHGQAPRCGICGRPCGPNEWDGGWHAHCCRTCAWTEGRQHGPRCEESFQARRVLEGHPSGASLK